MASAVLQAMSERRGLVLSCMGVAVAVVVQIVAGFAGADRRRYHRPMLKRLVRRVLLAPVVLLLLFEEWGWAPLAALVARLTRLPLWSRLERWIGGLSAWAALALFVAPMLALFPVKLAALFLLAQGKLKTALVLLVAAKLLGTAVLARLFQLTQPALMQLAWFAYWYPRWKDWKDGVLARVHASAAWQWARNTRARAADWAGRRR